MKTILEEYGELVIFIVIALSIIAGYGSVLNAVTVG